MAQDPGDEVTQLRARIAELESRKSTVLSGVQLIVLVTFVPMMFAFLALAVRMIWSATSNPDILENIEGLLAALAILSNPISAGMGVIMGGLADEIKGALKNGKV